MNIVAKHLIQPTSLFITALILQPGNKYSQYVNESFRITMASLDITYASKIQLLNSFVKSRDGIPETHLVK